ncbi:MAG: SDR family NAD(P)-dependent oxidoreductase, partial [Cyanobacteria bacterium J06649_11]
LNTNTFGAIRMIQELLPLLKKSSDARIVNVSSSYGEIDGLSADVPSYCLSKLALNGATIMLSQALRSEQIAVNSICPGWVKTDMGGDSAPRTPEQGADTAVWLATEAPRNETGKFWRDRKVISY